MSIETARTESAEEESAADGSGWAVAREVGLPSPDAARMRRKRALERLELVMSKWLDTLGTIDSRCIRWEVCGSNSEICMPGTDVGMA